ncbi:DUF2306 domain-containing protein [Aestuariivivens sediminicola]|uniref:DUF2306 domain-containing protein n=1 Tax=Aestuariivivens sediminicola TaxID=2913560 RepID=UPI001F567E5D|nr:DUF2306 domain-containing protein [Aestuariivivens sediminicola]
MKQSKSAPVFKTKSYLYVLAWLLLMVFSAKFIIKNALPYFGFDEAVFGKLWDYKWSLIAHVSGGILAIIIGPFQFWKSFRNKFLRIHKLLGRIYLIAILIGTLSAIHLAWTSALKIHWTWAMSLQGLAFAWMVTAGMAYISVRRKRIQQHRDWMARSYVVTFAFVTFRWLYELPMLQDLGTFIERGPTTIWVSWTVPLLITEIFISWNKKK